MEKIKLNNQIVMMRKHVKQAKVHSINRLSKQMKLLQNRKGDAIQVMKAKRKAERYLQEISLIKKVKPDHVSKLALSKTKDWKEVLSQKDSTLDDRCIAILASYGPVQKEVELFHNSNKDIVSKISDFFKQWEEKNKFQKDSSQKVKSNLKTLQNNTNLLKRKMADDLSNDTTNLSESTESGNSKLLTQTTDSSLLIENIVDSKSKKRKNEVFQDLSTSIETSENSVRTENACDKFDNNECLEENRVEIKISDEIENKPKKLLKNDSRNELENYSNSKEGDEIEIDSSESETENESDTAENKNSELEIFPENELKIDCTKVKNTDVKKLKMPVDSKYDEDHAMTNKKNTDAENVNTSCLIPVKMDSRGSKSGENKFKAIAVINLDDFRDLDEIPVNNSIENTEFSEEEDDTDDDSSNKVSQNDPFFLGRDEAVSAENELVVDHHKKNFVPVNEKFERKEKLRNHCNYTKNFHKPSNSSRFSSKYSPEFKAEKSFKTWKKDKVMQKSLKDRFHCKIKGSFDSEDPKYAHQTYKRKNIDRNDNIKNKKEFNKKSSLETYGQKYSNDLDRRNGSNFSKNIKKSDTNNKPLHPSWEAKRKQKEMINVSFQGKKIVFED